MGLFTRFLDKLGGPESVCKSLYTAYKLFIDRGYSHEAAMRQALENRYSVLKIIKKEEFPSILEDNKELALLALYCIIRENPYRGKENFNETALRVLKYFSDTDPSQCTTLAAIVMVMQEAVREGMKSMVHDFIDGDIAKYAEQDDYICSDNDGENTIKGQLVSLPEELESEWESLQKMNADAAMLALENSARGRELRHLLASYGALMTLHRADFFLLKERVDRYFPEDVPTQQAEPQRDSEVISCPECGARLRIAKTAEERIRIHCPACNIWFDRINKPKSSPQPSSPPKQETSSSKQHPPIIISCPTCQQRLRIPADKAVTVTCPSCGEIFDHP